MLIETYGQLSAERPFRILKITEKTEPYLLQNSPIGDNSCSATVTPAENLSEAQRNGYGEAVISKVFVNDRVLTVRVRAYKSRVAATAESATRQTTGRGGVA